MTSYLLDTHAFLWSIFDPSKLSPVVKKVLEDKNNEIAVSVISFWEISLKYALGKLSLTNSKPEDLVKICKKMNFEILEMIPDDAATFHKLERLHKDPFDRMIVWQSIHQNQVLLSKDAELKAYEKLGLVMLW